MRAIKLPGLARVRGIHFAPDGRLLAVGGLQAQMVDAALWVDVAAGVTGPRVHHLANSYAVTPTLDRLAVSGAIGPNLGDRHVGCTDPRAHTGWTLTAPHADGDTLDTFGLAIDPLGDHLFVGVCRPYPHPDGTEERVWQNEIWLYHTGTEQWDFMAAVDNTASLLVYEANTRRLAVAGGDKVWVVVQVFDTRTDGELFRFDPPGTRARALTFLGDGRLAVANARAVYVLHPDRPDVQFTLAGHKGQVNAVAASPDGRRLLTASHDGAVRAWDAATGELVAAFDWKVGPVTALAFAPDGLTCAAGGKGCVVVWDVE